jgi:hypothetical protein
MALVCCWCLLATKNVPQTHDGMGFVFIEAYRRAYRAGDYFPLWTPFGENGHGSAIFILYHRLHAQLAALVALQTGTIAALKISIPFWLMVGATGMRRYCRLHGVRPWVAWIAGLWIISSHYAISDWYVRGATAELSAYMLVPWGLRYATELFERRWSAVRLAVASGLIFFAHMIIFYFFLLTAAVVIVGGFLRVLPYGWARVRAATGRALTFGALLTCFIGPYAAAVTYAQEFGGVGKYGLRSQPSDFAQFPVFFKDPNHSWSRLVVEGDMSLEIGRWILLCLAVFVVLAPTARKAVWQRAGALALLAVWYLGLQHYGMTFWIDMLPGASKIQFPGRLLVYITTIAILCAAIATEGALRSPMPPVRLIACVLPCVAAACQGNQIRGMQSAIWWLYVDRTVAEEALANDTSVLTNKLSINQSWNDFLPHMHGSNPAVQPFLRASEGCLITSPTYPFTRSLADRGIALCGSILRVMTRIRCPLA